MSFIGNIIFIIPDSGNGSAVVVGIVVVVILSVVVGISVVSMFGNGSEVLSEPRK